MDDKSLIFSLIKEVLGEPGKSNKHRGQYSFVCPTCRDNKGGDYNKHKLEVNLKKGLYNCWVCGEEENTRGPISKLLYVFGGKKILSRAIKLGLKLIKNDKDGEVTIKPTELPKGFVRFEDANKNTLEFKRGWNYLTKKRGLSEKIIYKHNIGFTMDNDDYKNRVIIPSYDEEGVLNYFTSRSYLTKVKNKYKNPETPKDTIIFNENLINWDGTVYLVEGPFDHLVVNNSIPLLGKVLSDKLYNKIITKSRGNIVILLDGEEKIWQVTKSIYSKLNVGRLYGKIRAIRLNGGYDVSQINEEFGREGVIKCLRQSFKIKESQL